LEHLDELARDDKLNTIVLKQLQTTGRGAGLKGIEIIEGVVISNEEWTPQNVRLLNSATSNSAANHLQGYITSAQKLNRKQILNRYQKEVDHSYKKAGS
jgi:long-chain acyl-CoA synthetase